MRVSNSSGLVPSPVNHPTSDRFDDPEVLSWKGEPDGWWQRNAAEVGAGVGFGAVAGAAVVGGGMAWAPQVSRIGRAAAAVAAAGGAAALAAWVTHAVGERNNAVPPLPPRSLAPSIPRAASVPPVVGGELPARTYLGTGQGSYWETRQVQKERWNGKEWETYTDTERYLEYFDWDMHSIGQVGARRGYASVDEALLDMPAGAALVLRRQEGRIVAYDASSGSHWGDLDQLDITDPDVVAVVSPGGEIFSRRAGTRFDETRRELDRADTIGALGDSIGRYSLPYRSDPKVRVSRIVTGVSGAGDLPTALGELHARAGDQAVFNVDGRYQVAEVVANRGKPLDHNVTNNGLLVDGNTDHVVALEQEGRVWSPSGAWYIAPMITD